MANTKIIEMKAAQVAEIQDKIQRAQSVVVFDYRGLTVEEATALRAEMRKAGVEYDVIKNHMFGRAAEGAQIDSSIEAMLHGPSAFAFGFEDAVAPAKILKEFAKKAKKGEIKGGIVEGKVTSAADMDAIAELPPREVLLSRLLGSMKAPIANLAMVLDQIAKKQGGATEAAAE